MGVRVIVVGLWFFGFAACAAAQTRFEERQDVKAYVAQLVAEHGFQAAELETWLAGIKPDAAIIERISKPAEKVWTWGRYKAHLVDEARIVAGVRFWAEHTAELERAAAAFGVGSCHCGRGPWDRNALRAKNGRLSGASGIVDAGLRLSTARALFRKELTEFLLLTRQEGKDPRDIKGSYAGAMGYGQFIPSSYRHYAVDFDGDGVRDIWGNATDAIGSIANYFQRHGWGEGPVALKVEVEGNAYKRLVGP